MLRRILDLLFRRQPRPVDTTITLAGAAAGQAIALAVMLHGRHALKILRESDFEPPPLFIHVMVMLLCLAFSVAFAVGATLKRGPHG